MSEHKIPIAGVIGSPIAHSRSPALFRHWLRQRGLRGYYIPMDVSQSDLRQVIRTAPKMGFVGLNVTIPHKEAILEIADSVSDRAAIIGAANTISFRPDGSAYADNTDGTGFTENLRQNAPQWAPASGPAAVFGAGGAARAIIAALIEAGAPEVRITNRTRARAEGLRKDFGAKLVVYDWVQAGNIVEDAATVVNASSLGMIGKTDFRVPLDGLSPRAIVTDLVYTPLRTTFLQKAEQMGCATVDGLGMLLWQAVPNFERWFGEPPEVDEGTRAAALGR
jgi:shikimate dehydrogenase